MLIKGFREVFVVRNALISFQDPSADDVVPKTLFPDMLRQVVRIPTADDAASTEQPRMLAP